MGPRPALSQGSPPAPGYPDFPAGSVITRHEHGCVSQLGLSSHNAVTGQPRGGDRLLRGAGRRTSAVREPAAGLGQRSCGRVHGRPLPLCPPMGRAQGDTRTGTEDTPRSSPATGMPGSLMHRGRRFRPDRGTQQLEAGPLGTRESLNQRAGASPGGPSRGAAGRDGGGRCRPLPRARSRPRRRAGAAAGRAAASWGGARPSRPQGPRVGVARPPGLLLPHALPGLSPSTAPCRTQSNVPRRVFVLDLSDSRTHTGHELIRCVSGCPSVSPRLPAPDTCVSVTFA